MSANAPAARRGFINRSRRSGIVALTAAIVGFQSTAVYAAPFNPVEASISDLDIAFANGVSAVDVVNAYIHRINLYDKKTTAASINSIAELNPNARAEAAAIDQLIASGATRAQYPLLGVPVVVKNSFDVQGLTTTNGVSVLNGVGTPGSTKLIAPDDAFSVARLRAAGAIILGKTSMSTMAYSFFGIDNAQGVVKNPYNNKRSPGGSSSGSAASVAANFAMISLGGETGGSIRIPSNANAIVGLKTSIGLIDPEGTWPLVASRDVLGPMGKTVKDVAYAMNALVAPSSTNIWNNSPYYPAGGPQPGETRPADYTANLSTNALQGKVLAVPKSMANFGGRNYEGNVHPLVMSAFNTALNDLRGQGATIIYVDIPATQTWYRTLGRSAGATTFNFPFPYPTTTPTGTIPNNAWMNYAEAFYYNELIKSYNDPTIKNLADFVVALRNGRDANAGSNFSTLSSALTEMADALSTLNAGNAKGFGDADNDGLPDNPDAQKALAAFRSLQVAQYENFMSSPGLPDDLSTPTINESLITRIDAFVAPTYAGIVPHLISLTSDPDPYFISGGNIGDLLGRMEMNILGAPSINVPMGYAPDGTPMGIQFFNELLGEANLLGYAYSYEQATLWRHAPTLIPEPMTAGLFTLTLVFARRRRAD